MEEVKISLGTKDVQILHRFMQKKNINASEAIARALRLMAWADTLPDVKED